jgi:hypothetical protein
MESLFWGTALERYSQQHKTEVLRVDIEVNGQPDTILIFRGMSSSLHRSTPTRLSEPVIPVGARFVALDRLQAPYHPTQPQVIASQLTASEIRSLLHPFGLDPTDLEPDPR